MLRASRALLLMSPVIASLFTACGGGGHEVEPDVKASTAADSDDALRRALAAPAAGAYTLTYEEGFNSTALNEGDWFYRESGLYAGGYNRKQNVSVSGGYLNIAFRKEDVDGDGSADDYSGGGVISKKNFGYGYYEVKAKLHGGSNGFHQSFWSMGLPYGDVGAPPGYRSLVDAGLMPYYGRTIEIDGFEQDSNKPGTVKTNGHNYLPTHTAVGSVGHTVDSTQWFTMGYEWLPGQVKFYLNGTLVRTMTLNSLYGQSNFWLTGLANSVHSGALGAVQPGADYQVDYFRFYTSRLVGVNRMTNGGFEYNTTGLDVQYPMGWLESGNKGASLVYQDSTSTYPRTGVGTLWHRDEGSPYLVTTKQNVENIPNGTYKLTAWVKSSGGQTFAGMRVLNHGGAEAVRAIPAAPNWVQITLDNISVSSNKILVAFTSEAAVGQWIKVDDVVLEQK